VKLKRVRFFLHKIFNWEYWPQAVVYAPIFPAYLYYTAKARTPFFVVAANPQMENGGYIMESKFKIHQQLPQHLVPKTICISFTEDFEMVKQQLAASLITYPFFCKPDIGGKGRGVAKINDIHQLLKYHTSTQLNYLLQQEITFKNEIGVFYCRLPYKPSGFISGIVGKTNMEITGNGIHTVQQLIESTPRFYYQRNFLFKIYANSLNVILSKGERMILSEVGNHARGSLFTDVSHFNNKKLEAVIDNISKAYNTFYFGRYDIKFNTWEELYEGKNFMLIELNGSGSEPTHIYDPKKSLLQAWKIILQHWKWLYTIAAYHHKNGVAYLTINQGRLLQKQEKAIALKYPKL
jgi:hypothetical protein